MASGREGIARAQARYRVVATAVVYFRRFYMSNSFVEHDPRLVAPGCLYLAAKVSGLRDGVTSAAHPLRLRVGQWRSPLDSVGCWFVAPP